MGRQEWKETDTPTPVAQGTVKRVKISGRSLVLSPWRWHLSGALKNQEHLGRYISGGHSPAKGTARQEARGASPEGSFGQRADGVGVKPLTPCELPSGLQPDVGAGGLMGWLLG